LAVLRQERYFEWLGFEPPAVPSLDLHEIIGEKIRAAFQRSRVRDLYDLYQLADQRFDRALVRKIAVLKCWETNFVFDAPIFLSGIGTGQYDWADLRRLLRRGREIKQDVMTKVIQKTYAFLRELNSDETLLAGDPYRRQKKAYCNVVASLQNPE
jgi:hypothetical protein